MTSLTPADPVARAADVMLDVLIDILFRAKVDLLNADYQMAARRLLPLDARFPNLHSTMDYLQRRAK